MSGESRKCNEVVSPTNVACNRNFIAWDATEKLVEEVQKPIVIEDHIVAQKVVRKISPDGTWEWTSNDSSKCLTKEESSTSSLNKKKCKRKKLIWHILAALSAFSGVFCLLFNPREIILDVAMKLGPDSRYLQIWRDPPVTLYASFYIFNVTNPKEFLNGKEKLRLEEVGPFVFIEHVENTNIVFNENGTMSYTPRRSTQFNRELSVGDIETMNITVPNIVLLGLGSMVAESSVITNLGVLSTIKYLGSKPFLNLTVSSYLYGYDDPLVEIAHTLVSNWIPFAKLGILDRMYDEGENRITIRLEDNGLNDTDPNYLPKYSIETWNGSPGLENWGYTDYDYDSAVEPFRPTPENRCKLIKGASEGQLFQRNMNPNMTNYVFRKSFCRHMPISFMGEMTFMPGIPAYHYGLSKYVFETPEVNPEAVCYCNPNETNCLPRGLGDITPCYYNIPASVSFPHFLDADPMVLTLVDGLSPDREKHGSFAIIQPELGSILNFTSRIQTNLIMKDIKFNTDLIPFSNIHVPLFWVELKMSPLPLVNVIQLYYLIIGLPIQIVITYILAVASTLFLIISLCYQIKKCRNRASINLNKNIVETLSSPFDIIKPKDDSMR